MAELQIPQQFIIHDLETLKVISDPTRMELIRYIGLRNKRGERCTVKQLAEHLHMPSTKLYYHVNMLEEHGLILVGETQIVSGIIEKHYQVAARSFTVSEDITSITEDAGEQDEFLEQMVKVIEQVANAAVQDMRASMRILLDEERAAKAGGPPARKEFDPMIAGHTLFLAPQQAKDLTERMEALSEEFSKISDENHRQDIQDGVYFGWTTLLAPHYHRTSDPHEQVTKE